MTVISTSPWKPSRVVAESSGRCEFHSCHHPPVTNSVSLALSSLCSKMGVVRASLSSGRGVSKNDREVSEMMQATHSPQGLVNIKRSTEVSLIE